MRVEPQLAIPVPHEEIAAFCRKWGIRRLAFFGSVVRDDFRPESDVDVLVEFRDRTPGLKFFWDVPNELSQILGGRTVDLLTPASLSNWMKREVAATAVPVYDEEV
ncbi:MAG TPA: nucleotidyltransferase family protein [Thermoanaerobaculia bacterium]|nr:nucleotidyltransferase family protein [Thermoanaerobaculia bacterium]